MSTKKVEEKFSKGIPLKKKACWFIFPGHDMTPPPGGYTDIDALLDNFDMEDHLRSFRTEELYAWKQLAENDVLLPLWEHLAKFEQIPEVIFELLGTTVVEAYDAIKNESLEWREMELKLAQNQYCYISESIANLQDAISLIPDVNVELKEEIEKILKNSDLSATLSELLAKTTSCEWPKLAYQSNYGGAHNLFGEYDAKQTEETYEVFSLAKSTKNNPRPEPIFEGIAYAPKHMQPKDGIYLAKADSWRPQKFSAPELKVDFAEALTARKQDTSFLQLCFQKMANFSSTHNLSFSGFGTEASEHTAIWLPPGCWARLLHVLFPEEHPEIADSSSSEVRHIKRIIDPKRFLDHDREQ